MKSKNNSIEMKTIVETFIVEETEALIYDNDHLDKWNSHVYELGLTGQTKIRQKHKSPIPFLSMDHSLIETFRELCPVRVDIQDYDRQPIPVEILDLVSLATKEGYFKKIEVWYDDKTPDPVVVGMVGEWRELSYYSDSNKGLEGVGFATKKELEEAGGKHPYFNETVKYLIGKWGDVKQSFEDLRKRASDRYISSEKVRISEEMKRAKRDLEDLQDKAFRKFNSNDTANEILF